MGGSKTTRRGLLAGAAALSGLAGVDNDLAPFIRRAKASPVTETAGPVEIAFAEYIRLFRVSELTADALDAAEDRDDKADIALARERHSRATKLEKAAAHRVFDLEPDSFREVAFQAAILRVDWFADRVDKVLDRLVRLARIAPADSEDAAK